jgi:hypothetical protein
VLMTGSSWTFGQGPGVAPLQGPAAGLVQRLTVSLRTVRRTGSFHGGGSGVLSQALFFWM